MHRMKFTAVIAILSGIACLAVLALSGSRATDNGEQAMPFARGKPILLRPDGLSRNAEPSIAADSALTCDRPHVALEQRLGAWPVVGLAHG